MGLVLRHALPRMIERGVTQTLDWDVYDEDDNSQQTPTEGTVSIYNGGSLEVDGDTVTAAAPSTYSLAGSVTSSKSLSDQWLEVVTLKIGGIDYTFRRQAFVVRHLLYPVLTDTDLTDIYDDLDDLLDSDTADFSEKRVAAWEYLQRWLIRRGRRPELVLNAYELLDAHREKTFELIFGDFAASTQDPRYADRERHHREQFARELEQLVLRYDADEDGAIDPYDERAGVPVIHMAPRRARGGW